MIVTRIKPYGIIRGMLRKWKTVGVVSCNSCARVCETGGKEKMDELANRLKQDGFDVVDTELLPMACNIESAKKPNYKADYLVVLACDSGVCTLQSLFPNKIVVQALDTIGLGARDVQGNIFLMKKF
jgi:hypothetical protein